MSPWGWLSHATRGWLSQRESGPDNPDCIFSVLAFVFSALILSCMFHCWNNLSKRMLIGRVVGKKMYFNQTNSMWSLRIAQVAVAYYNNITFPYIAWFFEFDSIMITCPDSLTILYPSSTTFIIACDNQPHMLWQATPAWGWLSHAKAFF